MTPLWIVFNSIQFLEPTFSSLNLLLLYSCNHLLTEYLPT